MIKKSPLFTKEEFYCFIRPKLLNYTTKGQSDDDMLDITSAKNFLEKLRRPLTLATMRAYFRELASGSDSMDFDPQMEEDFPKTHPMSDTDTWAFTILSDYFKERLRKVHTFKRLQKMM